MSPTKKRLLAILSFACILVLCNAVQAQVSAGISANGRAMIHGDTINVCLGSTIIYESLSQGTSLINWRFNNGAPNIMTGAGPFSITYNVNGYDTTFQKVGMGAFADSMYIIVRVADEKPIAGYNFLPNEVCGNETISFTNTTVNGAPFSYVWYFGDSTTSVDESPTHQYLDAVGMGTQAFPVKLVVTNANTCVDSITHTVTIRSVPDATMLNADPAVTVGSYQDTASFRTCNNESSYIFSFTNGSSTIAANSSYAITWGDGSADTTFSAWPAGDTIRHAFPAGSSTMTIRVTGASGCVGIKNYIVYVGAFPYGTIATSGSNEICEGDQMLFNLTNTAGNSIGTSYIFYINDFSEGQFFKQPPPAIISQRFTKNSCSFLSDNGTEVYSNALGAYLLVQNPCGVNSSSVVPIYVSSKPKASIFVSDSVTCINSRLNVINTSGYGNIITPGPGVDATCGQNGKNVWTITPATGFTILSGNFGSLNGNATNQSAWTDASDSLDIEFSMPGVYSIKVYVGNDKCGTDSIVRRVCVRTPPKASFTMSQKVSCGPATVDFTNTSSINECNPLSDLFYWSVDYSDPAACAIAGDPTYSFVNGTSDTTKSPSLLFHAAGRYIIHLLVKAANPVSGCAESIFTDTFFVKGKVAAELANLPLVCVNNAVNPAATITNCYLPGPLGYQWSFAGGNPSVAVDSLPGPVSFPNAGDHLVQLIVTDSSCMQSDTASATLTVNPSPPVTVINDTTICSGETIGLGGAAIPGVVYEWSPAAGLSDAFSANPAISINYNGSAADTLIMYYLHASQGSNCNYIDSVSVRVSKYPVVTVTATSLEICNEDSAVLTAAGADTYTWEPTASLSNSTGSSVIAKPGVTTNYTVTGLSAAGCAGQQNILVTVFETPVSSFMPHDVQVCGQDTIINFTAVTEGGGDALINYQWFVNDNPAGDTNPFSYHFQSTSAAAEQFIIRLDAHDNNGCGKTSFTGKIILNPVPVPDIQVSPALVQQQPNYEFTFKDINPGTPNMTYAWTMGDRAMQTLDGQQVTYQFGDTGTYKVRLNIADYTTGCRVTDSVNVTILYVPGYIQVPNAICPGCNNQSVRKFLPLATGLKKYRLVIYTAWGQKVFETTSLDANGSPNVPWDGTANGKPLQQDVYSWQIEGLFRNGTEWKGMVYPGKIKPVKAGFITVIK